MSGSLPDPRRRATTMADVAAAAGVSVMTVSYAFGRPDRVSDETRRRVLAIADTLGYTGPHRGAQSLRRGRTNDLAVVLTETLTFAFDDPHARRFFSGIADACLDTDTGLVLLPNARDGVAVHRVRDAAVDGYVFWTTVDDDPALAAAVATGRPVCVQGGPADAGAAVVTIEDTAAAEAVAREGLRGARRPMVLSFPADRGRRREVVHGPDPDRVAFPVTRHRLRGYRTAAEAAGLSWAEVPVVFGAGSFRAEGRRAVTEYRDVHRPDAVLAMSDELALGAMVELGADVASGAVSVVGWDDSTEAADAGLTTVAQSLHEQGRIAARIALGAEVDTTAHWSLVTRSSTRS
ncbi:LacI family DNA-binding transcriptional regulator [Rhodococcoides kroppenstedtii]|uniref:LacI family DNA-binding transcriptional regulator n=1 Tax=Rhodococcoides kroppenstedtii TaxID=293050 RepID=UPI003633039A